MDKDLSKGKIYKITSTQTDRIYIGSTVDTLQNRFCNHVSTHFSGKGITSGLIIQYDDAKIELIEEWPCESKQELLHRERHWIEQHKDIVVNHLSPIWTPEERAQNNRDNANRYAKLNPEKVSKYQKQYYQENAEKVKERVKNYKIANAAKIQERCSQTVHCELCDKSVVKYKFKRHTESAAHIKKILEMKFQPPLNEDAGAD